MTRRSSFLLSSIAGLGLAMPLVLGHTLQEERKRPAPCDREAIRLAQDVDDELRYKHRDSRCEGLFRPQHAGREGDSLPVVSVYSEMKAFEATGQAPLRVTWPDFPGRTEAAVRLRGQSKRPKVHYQMDAEEAAAEGFLWPRDLLRAVFIDSKDLVVKAWYEAEVGGEPARVYLPVRIAEHTGESGEAVEGSAQLEPGLDPNDPIRLVIEVRLDGVATSTVVSLGRMLPDGTFEMYVREQPLIQSGFSEGGIRRFEVELQPPWGLHRIELGVVYLRKGPAAAQIYCAAYPFAAGD